MNISVDINSHLNEKVLFEQSWNLHRLYPKVSFCCLCSISLGQLTHCLLSVYQYFLLIWKKTGKQMTISKIYNDRAVDTYQ